MRINIVTPGSIVKAAVFGIGIVFCSDFLASLLCNTFVTLNPAGGSKATYIAAFLVLRIVIYFSVLSSPWHTMLLIRRKQRRGPQFVLKSCAVGITLFVLLLIPKIEALLALFLLTGVLAYQYIAVTWTRK